MEEPNREEIKAMIEITDANRLPYDLNELRTKVINWREVTNCFDHDTMKAILGRWEKYEDRKAVAWMMGSKMTPLTSAGKSKAHIQANLDLLYLYTYKEGSREYKLLETRMKDYEEIMKREELEKLKSSNRYLKQRVERLEAELKEAKELDKQRIKEIDKWHALWEEDEREIDIIESNRAENEVLKEKYIDLQKNPVHEGAYNIQTQKECFTSRQMGILIQAVAELTEKEIPGKTTIGKVIESISGYSATTVQQNMKGVFRPSDIEKVAKTLDDKLPVLAAKVRRM